MEELKKLAEAAGFGFIEEDGEIILYEGPLIAFVGSPKHVREICRERLGRKS